MRAKITVVGAGNVGATLAQRLAERNDCDIVIADVVEGLAEGKALDLLEAGPIVGYDSQVEGTTVAGDQGWGPTRNSTIVVITSGLPRKPGMSRDDLVMTNAKIVAEVTRNVVRHSPDAILMVVSNPLDAMAQVAYAVSGFPAHRVIGMAGVLDTARFRTFLAQELNASVTDVEAYVLGGHGDSMVPLTRLSTVAGAPVSKHIQKARLDGIVDRARNGGAEIVNLLKTGSAFYAPSAAVAQMVDAILRDTHKVLPCAAYLDGEYGIKGLFTGVPCKLGGSGIASIVDVELHQQELEALHASANSVRELIEIIDSNRADIGDFVPPLGDLVAVG